MVIMLFRPRMWMFSYLVYKKKLTEDKMKKFGFMEWTEDISRHPSIDYVLWLLVITLIQIDNKKQQAGQREICGKQSTRKCNGA